jgi:hypothetical protein
MINAIRQFFSMITTLFAMGEDFALAGKAISEYTKDGATAFNREAQLERKASHDELEKKLIAKGLLTEAEAESE